MDYAVVIDPSHGGADSGQTGNGIIEKNWVLSISQYMYERLRKLGVPVTLIRNSDETISNDERVKRILEAYGNNSNVIVLSNHTNVGGGYGEEIIYALRNSDRLASLIINKTKDLGLPVDKYFQRRLPGDTSKDYYYILRDTWNTQALLLEYGYVDNAENANLLKTRLQDYAEGVISALAEYLGFTYTPPAGQSVYIVEAGDTIESIAEKLGITVAELKAYNDLTSNELTIGQVLLVPFEIEEQNTYTVQGGDSLYSIARKFNISVDVLKEENNLSSNIISIGQVLRIPASEPVEPEQNYIVYIVKSGDNLYAIARRFNTTVDIIKDFNNLTSNTLQIGQELLIPNQEENENENVIRYTVKSGDNLYAIARTYNTTVQEIKNLNNLTSNTLSIGQVLLIPSTSSGETPPVNTFIYTVKSGDNLYAIARTFNTTVNEIKLINNLSSDTLSIGQKLLIPSSDNNNNQVTYTVKSGDTLYQIANRYGTTVNAIKNLNNLTSNNLSVGQQLLIPTT